VTFDTSVTLLVCVVRPAPTVRRGPTARLPVCVATRIAPLPPALTPP